MSDLIERVYSASRFPTNTCPASRHAVQIGEALVRGEPYPMLTEEPDHCGESILSVVASLWEARTEIERLTAERDAKLNGWMDSLIELRRRDAARLKAVKNADQQGRLMIQTRLRAIEDCISELHRKHSAQPVLAKGTGANGNAINAEQGSIARAGGMPAITEQR